MEINSAQYAKTLYDLTKDKSRSEIDRAVIGLAKILIKKKDTKLVLKIAEKFKEIWNKENEIVEAEITSREKLGEDLLNRIKKFVKEKYQAKEVVIVPKIDENIKGGIVIRVGDEVMDGSIENQISNLKKALTV